MNYLTSTTTFGQNTTGLQPSVDYSNLRKMQVCPSMQISETQTSCIAVKKDQYPAAQMSCIEKEFELRLAAQLSPQFPNSEGDSQPENSKISHPFARKN
jgi:hypothetical protein